MIAIGFTGAYTTFSTFEYESDRMLGKGDSLAAASYMAGSVFLGLLAVRLGARLSGLR
jgi:CrcB protein